MHSFRPSRARILFEVVCVLGIAASCAVAWVQTGASALLAVAGVLALYSLVQMFDLRTPRAAQPSEPQRFEFEPEPAEEVVRLAPAVEEAEPGTLVLAAESKPTKAPKKPRARKKSAGQEHPVKRPAQQMSDVVVPIGLDEPEVGRIEPLFEPEPFVRQPRLVVFGRKAG